MKDIETDKKNLVEACTTNAYKLGDDNTVKHMRTLTHIQQLLFTLMCVHTCINGKNYNLRKSPIN